MLQFDTAIVLPGTTGAVASGPSYTHTRKWFGSTPAAVHAANHAGPSRRDSTSEGTRRRCTFVARSDSTCGTKIATDDTSQAVSTSR
jgi:hypothetical protein